VNEVDKKIRQAIEARMNKVGLSNAELARKMKVSPQAVGQIINGQRGRIPDSLNDLLKAIGLELVVKAKSE
jgi:ribosome-binding protein aMBF1 (putative translation factor)